MKKKVDSGKIKYKTPKFNKYGPIGKLTLGGSVLRPEGSGVGNKNKMP